jgi:D-amino-acid oxidase
VVARDLPRETTSAVAAALWYPYRSLPPDRVIGWARTSYAAFAALAAGQDHGGDPDAGVRMVPGTEVRTPPGPGASEPESGEPWWRAAVPSVEPAAQVPAGWTTGWSFAAPIADMGVYLDWLAGRIVRLGGTITRLNLGSLPERGLVVNCSGLGARLLGHDPSVVPVQGQVAVLEQIGLDRWWLDATGPTYVVPRERDIVVGGTAVEGEWSRTPSPETVADILDRAARLVPALRDARVLRHRVGLRPVRPAVRLERVGDVVHCYGHGGAGVTLSWGVADDVVALLGG